MLLEDADRVLQDGVLAFDQIIRWQAALGLADAHGAARGVEPDPDLLRGAYLVLEARTVGKHVEVIG